MKNSNNNNNNVTVNNVNRTDNNSRLSSTAAAARKDVKGMGVMYYVNQLNKLAKKNDFVNNVNIKELGQMLQAYTHTKELFTARCFVPDLLGRPCYPSTFAKYKGNVPVCELMDGSVIVEDGKELFISKDGSHIVVRKSVTLSLTGLISAYRAILAPVAKEADKQARKTQKANNKRANKTAAAVHSTFTQEQLQAVLDFHSGKIDKDKFCEIMSRVA